MDKNNNGISKCPFMGGAHKESAGGGTSNRDWWPNQLKLNILRQNSSKSDPMARVITEMSEPNQIKPNFFLSNSLVLHIYTLLLLKFLVYLNLKI